MTGTVVARLRDHLESRRGACLELLEELAAIESYATQREGVEAVGDVMRERFAIDSELFVAGDYARAWSDADLAVIAGHSAAVAAYGPEVRAPAPPCVTQPQSLVLAVLSSRV